MHVEVITIEHTEITVPCYLADKSGHRFFFINEHGDLVVVHKEQITLHDHSDPATKIYISEAYNNSHGCTEDTFKEHLDRVLFKVEQVVAG